MGNAIVGNKVKLDVEAIKGTEYEFQFDGKIRKTVIVTYTFEHTEPTFEFKATPKARKRNVLPMRFIKC